jgi:hypothetical protein
MNENWNKIGEYILDLSKLVFGSAFLGAILSRGIAPFVLLLFGVFATGLLATGGFVIIFLNKRRN